MTIARVGTSIRRLRIDRNLKQDELAAQAGISVHALQNLESGEGATVRTLVTVLRALGREEWLKNLAPTPMINPLTVPRGASERKRARPAGEWTNQHLLSVNGKFKDITYSDLLAVADRFGIGTAPQVIDQVRSGVKRWAEFAERAGVPEKETRQRERQLLLLPTRFRKAP